MSWYDIGVSDASSQFTEVVQAMKEGKHPLAIQRLDALISQYPEDPKLLELRGVAKTNFGNLSGAEKDLRKARELDPKNPKILGNLAVVRHRQGKRIEAVLLAKEALEIDPEDVTAQSVIEVDQNPPGPAADLVNRTELWNRVGIAVILFGIAVTAFLFISPPVTPPSTSGENRFAAMKPKNDGTSLLVMLGWVCASIGCFTWIALDMIHRKARFTWIVPQAICSFCGLPWVPTLVYFMISRKGIKV